MSQPPKQHPQLWQIRLYYFILTGATAFLMPFLALFYRRQGFTGVEIGFLGTVSSITALVMAPFWGRWSDRLPDPRRLLQFAFLGSAVVYLLISQQDTFIWVAVLTSAAAFLGAGMDPLSDSMALNLIKKTPKTGFGSIRLWGSLGWAIIVLVSGWLIEAAGIHAAFIGYATLITSTAILLFFWQKPSAAPRDLHLNTETRTRAVIQHIFKDRGLVGLGLALIIYWLTRNGIYQFQAIYLDQLGARETLIGLNSTIGALVEMPGMLWADHLIRKHGSHRVMGLTFILVAIMAGSVAAFPTVTTIILASAVGGLGFSFYSVGLIVFLGERAPFGQTATTLALYTTTLRGMVMMVGGPLSGVIFDAFGAYWLYVISLVGSFICLLVFRTFVSGKRSRKLSEAEAI